jgi:hypothetical protein
LALHTDFNVIPVLDYRHGGDPDQEQCHEAASSSTSSSSSSSSAEEGMPDPYYYSAVLDRECQRDHDLRQLILTRQVPTVETIFFFIQVHRIF